MVRKDLPKVITAIAALVVALSNYTFVGRQLNLTATGDRWFQFSTACAFMIGAVNLTRIHGQNIRRRRTAWYNSVVLLVCLWTYFLYGAINGNRDVTYRYIYDMTLVHMEATMYSVVCFYIASAAYRSFRIRTREATVLLLVSLVVMLGNVPLGEMLWGQIPVMKDWFLRVPNSASMRAISLGINIGAFATCLRILLGLERAHLGAGS